MRVDDNSDTLTPPIEMYGPTPGPLHGGYYRRYHASPIQPTCALTGATPTETDTLATSSTASPLGEQSRMRTATLPSVLQSPTTTLHQNTRPTGQPAPPARTAAAGGGRSMSTGPAFDPAQFWYTELRPNGGKVPAHPWGGYD